MNSEEYQYLRIMRKLLTDGNHRDPRNGNVFSLFGEQMRFDLSQGFPLLTTKKVHFHSIVTELLWFLRGDTNIKFLHDHGVTIWDEWADEKGDLGPVYGKQWRSWVSYRGFDYDAGGNKVLEVETIDQIKNVIEALKTNPYGRRHVVTAWNPADIEDMALPPCHCLFQFYVSDDKLSCQLYQRSADWFLGTPFNVASYALLTILIAREVGLGAGELIHTFGDYHLYEDHRSAATIQSSRQPRHFPQLVIKADGSKGIFDLEPGDFELDGYNHHEAIKAPVSK